MIIQWVIAVALLIIGAVVLVVIGLRQPNEGDLLQNRLSEYAAKGRVASLEEIELSLPFTERVITPIARRLGEFAIKFTPQNAIMDISRKLDMAGNSATDPTLFFVFRFLGIPLGGICLLLDQVAPPNGFMDGMGIPFAILSLLLSFYLPVILLNVRIARRQKEIRSSLPEMLDLLATCTEAGLGTDAAMSKVYDNLHNEVAWILGRTTREIQLGKLRREALWDMADRVGIPEMDTIVADLLLGESLGVNMADALRYQADQIRAEQYNRMEDGFKSSRILELLLVLVAITLWLVTPLIVQAIH